MTWLRFCLPLCLLAGVALGGEHPALAQGQVPHFEKSACPFKITPYYRGGKLVRCGYLVVPEDRSRPDSPSIRLAVAIFKSHSAHPAPDPVFLLNGGPGGDTVALGADLTKKLSRILVGNHDLVLIDQRGTGYSRPSLACPELGAADKKAQTENLTAQQEETIDSAALLRCHDRLTGQGVDLSDYTTEANAADIADLRKVLGYTSIDLYGASYGTRLALTVMRLFPDGIRSVVLDSVYASEINVFTDPPRSGQRSLNMVFDSCSKAQSCHSAFPNLETDFYALINRLNDRPVMLTVKPTTGGRSYKLLLTGRRLYGLIFQSLYITPLLGAIPTVINQAVKGQYALVSQLEGLLGSPLQSGSMGMYMSVECSEDAPFVTPQQVSDAVQGLPDPVRADQLTEQLGLLDQCRMWNVKSVDAAQKQPVTSAIPTLILEGEFDPITPPSYGQLAAQTLSHSFTFVFPGTGHGVRFTTACPQTIMWSFLAQPTVKPDTSCIARMPEPFH